MTDAEILADYLHCTEAQALIVLGRSGLTVEQYINAAEARDDVRNEE